MTCHRCDGRLIGSELNYGTCGDCGGRSLWPASVEIDTPEPSGRGWFHVLAVIAAALFSGGSPLRFAVLAAWWVFLWSLPVAVAMLREIITDERGGPVDQEERVAVRQQGLDLICVDGKCHGRLHF